MRSILPLLHNWEKDFEGFSVELKTRKKKIYKDRVESYLVLTTYGLKGGKKHKISYLDSGIDNTWGGVFDNILKRLQPLLDDQESCKWSEVKKVITDYWHKKQESAIKEQKRKKAKTIYTPAGDYTLWQICEHLTYTLALKYNFLKKDSMLISLKKKQKRDFDNSLTRLVLMPISEKRKIFKTISSNKTSIEKSKNIIDIICDSKVHTTGIYEDIANPEYKDTTKLLSRAEQRELGALWRLYEDDKAKIEAKTSLSDVEQKLESKIFWESPQGKRLNKLNSRRVRGGSLSFEQKEKKIRKRANEISESLFNLLASWELGYEAVLKGLDQYQVRFEFATMERWKREREFRKTLDRGKLQLEYLKEIMEGKWDSDSVNLFGVLVGVSLAVGTGLASIVPCYKLAFGITGSVGSVLLYVLLSKWMFSRKLIIRFMRWAIK